MAEKRANMSSRWSSFGWSGAVIVTVLLSQRKGYIVDNSIAQRQPPQRSGRAQEVTSGSGTLAMLLAAHHLLHILDG